MSINEGHSVDFDNQCDQRELEVIKNFKENINSQNKGLIGKEKVYGLPIFWELIQDKMT